MDDQKTVKQNPASAHSGFVKTVLITAGIFIPIILILLLSWQAFKVLLLILAGALFAAFFRGLGKWIHKHTQIPIRWSVVLAIIVVVGLSTLVGWLLVPQIADQVSQLSDKLPEAVRNLKEQLKQSQWGTKLVKQIPDDPITWLQERSNVLKRTIGVFSATFGVLADLYIILFIGLFFMANPKVYCKGVVLLVPSSGRKRAWEVLNTLGNTLQQWIAGKLLSMLVVAVFTSVGLWLLGVPLAIALGLIAGLLAFVRNFGPALALVTGVLFGFLQGPTTALHVALLYIGIQIVESNIITPLIQKKMVELPPATVLIAQVLLGVLTGGLGLILATPIVAIVMVLVNMLYVQDILGDQSSGKLDN